MNDKLVSWADIIAAVKSPLGFFVLVALTTQAVLILIAPRAEGFNLTLLIIGMILTLFLLVVIVYVQSKDIRNSNQTRQNVDSALKEFETGKPRHIGEEIDENKIDKIPGEFESIKPYIDWQKFHDAVIAWARRNKAQNAWNLGPKNYLRCLYDLGIPGGKRFELKDEQDGSLVNQ